MRWRKSMVIVSTAVVLLIAQAAAASGYLDPTFGQRGTIGLPDLYPPKPCCPLSALSALAFGSNGRTWADATEGSADYLYAFTSAGKPDTTFHSGKPLFVFSADGTEAIALLPRADGSILVVDEWCCEGNGESGVTVSAIKSNGAADTTYGDQRPGVYGTATHSYTNGDYNTYEDYSAAVMLPSGAVRVCGSRQTQTFPDPQVKQLLLVGFTPTGQPDTAVGPQGWRVLDGLSGCDALVADSTGDLLAAGTEKGSDGKKFVRVTHLTPNGDVDTTYGVNGVATLIGSVRAISLAWRAAAIDPNGGLLLGIKTKDPGQRWMAATSRINPNGTVDATFGYGGIYRYVPSNGSSAITSLNVTRNGKALIFLTYATTSGRHLLLDRIMDATGRVDPSFGTNGVVAVSIVGFVALTDTLGRIVSGGPIPDRSVSYIQRRFG